MVAWNIGYAVALGLVGVVVILLVTLIILASRAAAKAEAIVTALDLTRENTVGLTQIDTTNSVAGRIIAGATATRLYLAAKLGMS